jgi:hypothetical protein
LKNFIEFLNTTCPGFAKFSASPYDCKWDDNIEVKLSIYWPGQSLGVPGS